jgi:hypothetical protein
VDAVDDVPDVPPDALRELGGRRLSGARLRLLAALAAATVLLLGVAAAALVTRGGARHPTNVGTAPVTSVQTVTNAASVRTETVIVLGSGGGSDTSSSAVLVSALSGVAALLTGVAALITALRAPRAAPAPAPASRRRR